MSAPAHTGLSGQNLDVDTGSGSEHTSDYDSVYSNDDLASLTSTLTSRLEKYKYENGRRYHSYKEGEWFMPNDEDQQDQMDIFHEIFLLRLDGKLYLAPIGDRPQRILDLGTGTGIWSMQMADKFASAAVVGNDLSPIQPSWVPPNCTFEVDDFNEQWSYSPESFDYIHGRSLHGAVSSWPHLIKESYKALKPGGYVEIMNELVAMYSDDGSLAENSETKKWMEYISEGLEKMGKTGVIQPHIQGWMKDASFTNVTQHIVKIPIGTWPKDKKEKQIGAMNLVNLMMGLEGFIIAVYTRVLGWSVEDAQKHIAQIRKELKDKKNHIYFKCHITYAQKPLQ